MVIARTGLTQQPGIPDGGTTGQVLIKSSSANYDVQWGADPSDFIPGKTVTNYAALPAAATSVNLLAIVLNAQGVWPFASYKAAGIWYSDGVSWTYEGDYALTQNASEIVNTPAGHITATNVQDALNQLDTIKAPAASNTVYVASLSDFPAPVAGNITLSANTIYRIIAQVSIGTNTLTMGAGTVINGLSAEVDVLTYTGTGAMINATNNSIQIDQVGLSAPNGSVFAITGTNAERFHLIYSNVRNFKNLGTISNINDFNVSGCDFRNGTGTGFLLSGTVNHIEWLNNTINNNAGKTLDIDSTTFTDALINGNSFGVSGGQTGISAGAYTAGSQILITSNTFSGGGTYVTGLDISDIHVVRLANGGIDNTQITGECYLSANATSTTITVAGTYYKAAGTSTSGNNSQFTATNNRITYNGLKTNLFLVNCSASLSCGTPNQTLGCILAKNGSTIAGSEQEIRVSSASQSSNGNAKSIVSLSTGDYVELWVTNKTATNAVTVEYMNLTAR